MTRSSNIEICLREDTLSGVLFQVYVTPYAWAYSYPQGIGGPFRKREICIVIGTIESSDGTRAVIYLPKREYCHVTLFLDGSFTFWFIGDIF